MFGFKFRSPIVLSRVTYVVDVDCKQDSCTAEYNRLKDAKDHAEAMVKAYHLMGIDANVFVSRFADGQFEKRLFESFSSYEPVLVINRRSK